MLLTVSTAVFICVHSWPWKWPFVDISFFEQNATHLWDAAPEFNSYIFSKVDLFPVHPRPLADLMLPAPRDTYAALRATYGQDLKMCTAHAYSHRLEAVPTIIYPSGLTLEIEVKSIDCSLLKEAYSFVHRMQLRGRRSSDAGHEVQNSTNSRRQSQELRNVGIIETLMIGELFISSKIVDEPTYALTDAYRLQLMKPAV
jgi:hypothetical protein